MTRARSAHAFSAPPRLGPQLFFLSPGSSRFTASTELGSPDCRLSAQVPQWTGPIPDLGRVFPMRNNQFLIGFWLPLIRNDSFLFRVRLSPLRNSQFLIGFSVSLIRNDSFLIGVWLSPMRNSRFLIGVWLPESGTAGLSGGSPKGQRDGFRRPCGPLTPKKVA